MHNTAALAVALREAAQPSFKDYAKKVVANARALAEALMARGFDVVSGGTDNHLILVDLTNKNVSGKIAAKALDRAGIELNYNSVPYDTRKPFDPVGDPPGVAVGHQPGHGRRRDEADRRLDGPGDRVARRRRPPRRSSARCAR